MKIALRNRVLVVRNDKIMKSGIFALIRLSLFTELAKIKYEQEKCAYEQKRYYLKGHFQFQRSFKRNNIKVLEFASKSNQRCKMMICLREGSEFQF